MKFSTAIIATTLLATSVFAIPTEKREAAPLQRAQRFNNWCIGPGQMCYKSKRDLDQAATDVLDGYYATDPTISVEKREAAPLQRAQRFNNWCIGPGQMCYKSKRDLEQAATDILDGYYAPNPEVTVEKREADPLTRAPKFNNWCIGPGQMCGKVKREAAPLQRTPKFNNWCIGPGQMCYKSKRDLDQAVSLVAAGFEAPLPEQ